MSLAPTAPRLSYSRKTVHHYFRIRREDGTFERIHAALRKHLRVRMKRDPQPSAGVVDSQSLKSIGVGGAEHGYDGGKKVKGRKRHLLVDTQDLLLKAKVHSAKVMDYEGIKTLLEQAEQAFPRLSHVWLDGGERTRVQIGWRRHWGGVPSSSSVNGSLLLERC